jgi:hypothetical protein
MGTDTRDAEDGARNPPRVRLIGDPDCGIVAVPCAPE